MEINLGLRQYLNLKRWKYKNAGDGENIILTCPFCGKKDKLWIHTQTTQYRCWHVECAKTGNIFTLKLALGDIKKAEEGASGKLVPIDKVILWHERLQTRDDFLEYLHGRGITDEAMAHFKLGLQYKDEINWLVIPHMENGVCRNIKRRALDPVEKENKWRRTTGYPSILFNRDALQEHDDIIIAESELDTVSYWVAGVKNVIGLTCGAGTFLPEWYDQLKDIKKVTLALDADKAGEKGAKEIAHRLGYDRCYNIVLPLNDPSEVLEVLGPEELARTLDLAEQFEVDGIVTFDELLARRARVEERTPGIFTPWVSVNKLLGRDGMQPGDLVVLSARYKVGKTSWALQDAKYNGLVGVPTLFNCLEMSNDRLIDKIAAHFREKDIDKLEPLDYTMTRFQIGQMPLVFVESKQRSKMKVDDIFNHLSAAVRRYGIRFLVFDHLHFLCRSLQHLTAEIGQVTRGFKLFAEDHGVVVMLIAQPKKIGKKVIDSDDLKDSVSIATDADRVILLHRDRIPAAGAAEGWDDDDEQEAGEDDYILSPKTLVKIDATRFGKGGSTYQYYDGARSTFFDLDKNNKIIKA